MARETVKPTPKVASAKAGAAVAKMPRAARPGAKAAPKAAKDAAAAVGGATLRRKELVERVAAATGLRNKDVKDVVAATLQVLGDALAADETLALPPFGKARVNRHRDMAGGEMLTVKLRRGSGKTATAPATEGLAPAGE